MKKPTLILCCISLFSQCNIERENITNYIGYYDNEQKLIKMKGQFKNGMENGEWKYYDENGSLLQYGIFKSGIQSGSWIYSYPMLQDTFLWIPRLYLNNISFSLPENFIQMERDSSMYSAFDSTEKELYSLKLLHIKDSNDTKTFFNENYKSFLVDFNVISAQSSLVRGDELEYYLDEYSLQHKQSHKPVLIYMIYKQEQQTLVIHTYTASPDKQLKAKFILGDIFYHCWIKGKRLADPFTEIKDVTNL